MKNIMFNVVEDCCLNTIPVVSRGCSPLSVFRSFARKYPIFLRKSVTYYLYAPVDFGYQKIAAAYWNGHCFVKIATKIKNKDLVDKFLNDNKDFVL